MAAGRSWQRAFRGSVPEAAATARWLEALAAEADVPADTLYAIELCLEELLMNIVRHGGRADAKVEVTVRRLEDRIELAIEDDGVPFDITAVEGKRAAGALADIEPGGLGIGLVKSFANALTYCRAGLGNRLVAEFSVPPSRASV